MKTSASIDRVGLSLSALCVIHCLVMPTIGSTLPFIGLISENEWIHKGLVLLTLPIAFSLFISTARLRIQGAAALGAAFLCMAAFEPQFHEFETAITVIGASLLALAHIFRLMHQSHSH